MPVLPNKSSFHCTSWSYAEDNRASAIVCMDMVLYKHCTVSMHTCVHVIMWYLCLIYLCTRVFLISYLFDAPKPTRATIFAHFFGSECHQIQWGSLLDNQCIGANPYRDKKKVHTQGLRRYNWKFFLKGNYLLCVAVMCTVISYSTLAKQMYRFVQKPGKPVWAKATIE